MDILVIIIASAAASLVTLFSGFGLGTMLLPVFALFFPVDAAVALTGVVHLLTNLFKVSLLGRHADWKVVLSFGVPSVIGAFAGAELLLSLSHLEPLAAYTLAGREYAVGPLKLVIAILMAAFALAEMKPAATSFTPPRSALPAGGVLSGFFGGLSGHQGALRSIFLLQYGLPKESFLATGVVIACAVDVTRLSLYADRFTASGLLMHWPLLLAAVLAAFAGAYAGNRLLTKVTMRVVQRIVAFLLLLIAAGLGSGLL